MCFTDRMHVHEMDKCLLEMENGREREKISINLQSSYHYRWLLQYIPLDLNQYHR